MASENLGSSSSVRGVKHAQAVTAYTAAPRHRLNLVDAQFGLERKKEDNVRERYKKYFETSRQRKKRLWLERQEKRGTKERTPFLGWMYLPDLILEHIFKFLSYKVSHDSVIS